MPDTGTPRRVAARVHRNLTPDFATFLATRTERGAATDIIMVKAVAREWRRWRQERNILGKDIRVGSALHAAGYRITNLMTPDREAVVKGLRLRPATPLLALPPGLEPDDVMAVTIALRELARQRTVEGYTGVRDDLYQSGELERAAAEYLRVAGGGPEQRAESPPGDPGVLWPWVPRFWKPTTPQGDCTKGAALAVAALARRLRAGEGANHG